MSRTHSTACVCVCTCDRPHTLEELMLNLMHMKMPEHHRVELVIVDNGTSPSTTEVYDRFALHMPMKTHLMYEPNRGIPFARNHAVEFALEVVGAECVAFIDDDDLPRPDWLVHLLDLRACTRADIVFGRWSWSTDIEIPNDLKKVGLFRPKRTDEKNAYGLPSGIASCNVLIGRPILEKVRGEAGEVFMPDFARTGGEDTEFFIRATRLGASFCKSDKSIVVRRWNAERCTTAQVLRRSFALGVSQARISRLHLSRAEFRSRVFRAWRQAVKNLARLLVHGVLLDRSRLIADLSEAATRAGEIFSFYGGTFRYYR